MFRQEWVQLPLWKNLPEVPEGQTPGIGNGSHRFHSTHHQAIASTDPNSTDLPSVELPCQMHNRTRANSYLAALQETLFLRAGIRNRAALAESDSLEWKLLEAVAHCYLQAAQTLELLVEILGSDH